jgi:hypothetical protein
MESCKQYPLQSMMMMLTVRYSLFTSSGVSESWKHSGNNHSFGEGYSYANSERCRSKRFAIKLFICSVAGVGGNSCTEPSKQSIFQINNAKTSWLIKAYRGKSSDKLGWVEYLKADYWSMYQILCCPAVKGILSRDGVLHSVIVIFRRLFTYNILQKNAAKSERANPLVRADWNHGIRCF